MNKKSHYNSRVSLHEAPAKNRKAPFGLENPFLLTENKRKIVEKIPSKKSQCRKGLYALEMYCPNRKHEINELGPFDEMKNDS